MKASKHQAPRSREAPSTKDQRVAMREDQRSVWDEGSGGAFVLRDGPRGHADRHPFDLEERTSLFGESIIRFVKKVPRGINYPENNRLVDQLVGAGTSIGANYCEANE